MARLEPGVVLSEAKDLLAGIERRKMILRCAQDDKFARALAEIASLRRRALPLLPSLTLRRGRFNNPSGH